MYDQQTLKALLNERLLQTAEDIFLLFEQAAAGYRTEIDRLKNVSGAKTFEADASLSFELAQQTVSRDNENHAVFNEEKATHVLCKVETENDEPHLIIINVQSLSNGGELEESQQQNGNNKRTAEPEPRDNSFESKPRPKKRPKKGKSAPMRSCNCPMCDKSFTRHYSVKLHMERVHKNELAPDAAFSESVDNTRQKSPPGTHSCVNCGGQFRSRCSLRRHTCALVSSPKLQQDEGGGAQAEGSTSKAEAEQQNPTANKNVTVQVIQPQITNNGRPEKPSYSFKCSKCKANFSREVDFRRHMLNIHKVKKPFQCSFCSQYTETSATLRIHTMIHTGERPFKCSVCGKGFITNTGLKHHMFTHTRVRRATATKRGRKSGSGQSLKNNVCAVVGQGATLTLDRAQQRVVSRGALKEEKTEYFQSEAETMQELPIPQLNVERDSQTGKFICSICNIQFGSKPTWRYHFQKHSENDPYKCAECGKTFMKATHFSVHLKSAHSLENHFKCPVCYVIRRNPDTYKEHMLCHKKVKPFQCSVCGKGVINLRSHMLSHTKKPYNCSKCDGKFWSKYARKKHNQRPCQ